MVDVHPGRQGPGLVKGLGSAFQGKPWRTGSPTGWPDAQRIELLKELLDDDKLDFRIPSAARAGLRSVASAIEPIDHGVDLSAPIATVRKQLKGKKVVRFDGHRAFYA